MNKIKNLIFEKIMQRVQLKSLYRIQNKNYHTVICVLKFRKRLKTSSYVRTTRNTNDMIASLIFF